MSILSASLLLFLVFDPLGNIPVFTVVLGSLKTKHQRRIIVRELLIALFVLLVFLFAGRHILAVMKISKYSLGIAGGIILFLIAIKMIFSGADKIFDNPDKSEPFVVPLAIPLVAGPSAITTVILLMAGNPSRWMDWLFSVLCAWAAAGIILLFSVELGKLLGKRVLTAIERLMGMLLTTIAVEMFINGIKQSFL